MNNNIYSLSIAEKIKLAEELWASTETEGANPLSPALQKLLKKGYCCINKIQQEENHGKK